MSPYQGICAYISWTFPRFERHVWKNWGQNTLSTETFPFIKWKCPHITLTNQRQNKITYIFACSGKEDMVWHSVQDLKLTSQVS